MQDNTRRAMIPETLKRQLLDQLHHAAQPRELAVDVMFAVQEQLGYLNDDALSETAELLGMSPLELEELATFYPFVYRQPVGKFVIHVCDSVICWINGTQRLIDHLCTKLGIQIGQTTPDGLFTVLPVCCIGSCDQSPAMLVNRRIYGNLTPSRIDDILDALRASVAQEFDDTP